MASYGYVRISTKQQDLPLQIAALLKSGVDAEKIYTDMITGSNADRTSLKELLSLVEKGDVIVVKKLDRLGNSLSQVTNLVNDLAAKGVDIKAIDDDIDTSVDSPMTKAMFHLLNMFSEMERNFIVERTKPAIEEARQKGVKFGRPKVGNEMYEKAVKEYLAGGITTKELIKKYGKDSNGKDYITEATLYRRLKEYKKENG